MANRYKEGSNITDDKLKIQEEIKKLELNPDTNKLVKLIKSKLSFIDALVAIKNQDRLTKSLDEFNFMLELILDHPNLKEYILSGGKKDPIYILRMKIINNYQNLLNKYILYQLSNEE